jgi:hypothetical protein
VRKRKKKEITYSEAYEKMQSEKPKTRLTTKVYFWFFVVFVVLAMFMFYLARRQENPAYLAIGTVGICMSVFFGLIVFVRYIRSRSITSGLFLTTCISSGVFLGVSQILPIVVPPTAAAFASQPDLTGNGLQLLVVLAQIGLFAVWFAFLLFTIYLYVKPVKRIDKYLKKIQDGEQIKRVKIGHAKQYKVIEERIRTIASTVPRISCESSHLLQPIAETHAE